jgi:hypothetical protein
MVKQATFILDQRVAHSVDSDHSPYSMTLMVISRVSVLLFISSSATNAETLFCVFIALVPFFAKAKTARPSDQAMPLPSQVRRAL